MPVYQQEEEERRQQLAEEAYAREILNREPAPSEPEPISRENAHYAFSLGDTVYLGTDEYEVFSYDDSTVYLRDSQFPLFSKELARKDFDRMLRENPLNDHLITAEPETPVTRVETPAEQPVEKEQAPSHVSCIGYICRNWSTAFGKMKFIPIFATETPIPKVPHRS